MRRVKDMKLLLNAKDLSEGERKFSFAIYILHSFVAFIVFLCLYYTSCVLFTEQKPSDVLDFCKELSSLYLWGASAVLTIYNGSNVLAYKFGQKGPPASPPAPPEEKPKPQGDDGPQV